MSNKDYDSIDSEEFDEDIDIMPTTTDSDVDDVEPAPKKIAPKVSPKIAPKIAPAVVPIVAPTAATINEKENPYHTETWSDLNIFNPIAIKLTASTKELGLSENILTFTGFLLRVLTAYYIYNKENYLATFTFLIAYIFDCMQGNYETKNVLQYVMYVVILAVIIYKYGVSNHSYILVIIFLIMLVINSGMDQGILSYMADKDDNFYRKIEKVLRKSNSIFHKMFIQLTKFIYSFYRTLFPTYNQKTIHSIVKIAREFGPGNFTIAVAFIIFNL